MKRDINKVIRQKALQGDIDFFKSVSLSAFSNHAENVDFGTVTKQADFDENDVVDCSLECPEE